MRFWILCSLLHIGGVLGQSNSTDIQSSSSLTIGQFDFSKWQPAGKNDLRCGCPAMNSLANHGFLHHDGKNITVADVVPVMQGVFHLSEELATIVTNLALLAAPDPSKGVFTLGDLNKHNFFEHDASLSRVDFGLGGDGHTFDKPTFKRFLSFFGNDEFVTLEKAALARYDRVQASRRDNRNFTYGSQQRITSYGETIKYFRTMVDNKTGKTPLKFVKILFQEERIPIKEGWSRPNTEISGFSLASDVLELALRTPEKSSGRNDGTQTISRRSLPKECPYSQAE